MFRGDNISPIVVTVGIVFAYQFITSRMKSTVTVVTQCKSLTDWVSLYTDYRMRSLCGLALSNLSVSSLDNNFYARA